MNVSTKGRDLIKFYEGLRLKAYKCSAGVWTIGYGHTEGVKAGQTITAHQAEVMFEHDLLEFENAVFTMVGNVRQGIFDALVSFAFNLGATRLKRSSLLAYTKLGAHDLAASQFELWDNMTVNGKLVEVAGLHNRRMAERSLYLCLT